MNNNMKYCEFCGNQNNIEAVICPKCGHQLKKLKAQEEKTTKHVIINNSNQVNDYYEKKKCYKWTAFLLCLFLGYLGVHKFYEGKIGLGILYIFTSGFFGIGWFIDIIIILFKSNPYYI